MENAINKQHFKNLLSVAFADGILDKAELEFLFKKSDKFFITAEDIEGLIENSMHISPMVIEDKKERAEKMLDLIQMMLIDGEVNPFERRLCMSFGVSLGFAPEKMDAIIDGTTKIIEEGGNEDQMLELIQQFD
tara:strand:+ start:148691 stop:149092 length:402 start_codon:yes stop_codon:yes gene_type:complete